MQMYLIFPSMNSMASGLIFFFLFFSELGLVISKARPELKRCLGHCCVFQKRFGPTRFSSFVYLNRTSIKNAQATNALKCRMISTPFICLLYSLIENSLGMVIMVIFFLPLSLTQILWGLTSSG